MPELDQLLLSLGINITSNLIYDTVKSYFAKNQNPTIKGLKNSLTPSLNISGASIAADRIIEFLARQGDITIEGTHIYASDSIKMFSSSGTRFSFGDNSVSQTNKTAIQAGHGAYIVGQGGAGVSQDEDGSIRLFT